MAAQPIEILSSEGDPFENDLPPSSSISLIRSSPPLLDRPSYASSSITVPPIDKLKRPAPSALGKTFSTSTSTNAYEDLDSDEEDLTALGKKQKLSHLTAFQHKILPTSKPFSSSSALPKPNPKPAISLSILDTLLDDDSMAWSPPRSSPVASTSTSHLFSHTTTTAIINTRRSSPIHDEYDDEFEPLPDDIDVEEEDKGMRSEDMDMDVWEEHQRKKAAAGGKSGKGKGKARSRSISVDDVGEGSKPKPKRAGTKMAEEKAAALEEKERIKAVKLAEKAALKAAALEAKASSKATLQANRRITSKAATLQEILVDVSPSSSANSPSSSNSFSHLLDDFRERIEEDGSKVGTFDTSSDAHLAHLTILRFRRILTKRYDAVKKQWFAFPPGTEEIVPESTAIIYLSAIELAGHVEEGTLLALPGRVRAGLGMGSKAQVVVFVQGLKKYLGKKKKKVTREWKESVRDGLGEEVVGGGRSTSRGGRETLGREEIERALTKLQVIEKSFLTLVETDEEVITALLSTAGDIAIRPYKLIDRTHLPFCPDNTSARGHSSVDIYRKMLQQLPRVTLAVSNAVASPSDGFGTLRSLMESWDELGEGDQGEMMLADLLVKQNKNGVSNERAINQAISKRLRLAFRSEDELALLS